MLYVNEMINTRGQKSLPENIVGTIKPLAVRHSVIKPLGKRTVKKPIYTLLLGWFLLVMSACQKDDTALTHPERIYTVDEVLAKAASLTALPELMGATALDTTGEWQKFGPFTVTPTLAKELTNHHVVLTAAEGFEDGVYICDVYSARTEVVVPAGAIVVDFSASREGYSTIEVLLRNVGPITTWAVGDTVRAMASWSIVPKYDQLGRSLDNSPLPGDLAGTTFTYYYFQNL